MSLPADKEAEFLSPFIAEQLALPKNLSTDAELQEQARLAYKSFKTAESIGNGELTFKGLKSLCESLGLPMENDEEAALRGMDTDGSGTLDMTEWLTWWLKRVGSSPNPAKQMESLARNTFKRFDTDESGSMDYKELRRLFAELGAVFNDKEMAEALIELDTDGSGEVDEEEFVSWWTNRSLNKRKGGGLIALKLRKLASKAQQVFSSDIFVAVWQGDAELVKLFVDGDSRMSGACDSSEFGDGWQPLHYGSYRGSVEIVKCLLASCSGDEKSLISLVNKTTDKGFTPLFYAAQTNHLEVCNLLLEAGADPTISGTSDEFGEVPVSLCPADLCVDFPELDQILRLHEKCQPPETVPVEKIEATLSGVSGTLTIDLPGSLIKHISSLPIRKWCIELECGGTSLSPRPLSLKVAATSVSRECLSISTQIDKRWFRSLLGDSTNNNLGEDALELSFTVKVAAVNSLHQGPFSEPAPVVFTPAAKKVVVAAEAGEDKEESKA